MKYRMTSYKSILWHGSTFPPFIARQNAGVFIGPGQFDSMPVGTLFTITAPPTHTKEGYMYRKMTDGLRRIDSLKALKKTRKDCGLDDSAE
jgi:hypothetical protein